MARAEELRNMTPEELRKLERDADEELFNLRMQVATGQNPNNARIRLIRRELARILTVKREQELEAGS